MSFRIGFIICSLGLFLLACVLARLCRDWGSSFRHFLFGSMAVLLLPVLLSALELSTSMLHWDLPVYRLFVSFDKVSDRQINKDMEMLKPWMLNGQPYRQTCRWEVDGIWFYKPVQSAGFNINSLGIRAPEPTEKGSGIRRIGMVGGSTTWGSWVVDGETIPSLLERCFHDAGEKTTEVYNLGLEGLGAESSIRLVEKLQPLYSFDHVIFYQGVNDFTPLRPTEETTDRFPILRGLHETASQFNVFRVFNKGFVIIADYFRAATFDEKSPELNAWISANLEKYTNGFLRATAFCRENGIRCDVFLQPILFHKRFKSDLEQEMWENSKRKFPSIVPSYTRSIDAITRRFPGTHHNIVDALGDTRETGYMDWMHTTHLGNRIIARRIFDELTNARKPAN